MFMFYVGLDLNTRSPALNNCLGFLCLVLIVVSCWFSQTSSFLILASSLAVMYLWVRFLILDHHIPSSHSRISIWQLFSITSLHLHSPAVRPHLIGSLLCSRWTSSTPRSPPWCFPRTLSSAWSSTPSSALCSVSPLSSASTSAASSARTPCPTTCSAARPWASSLSPSPTSPGQPSSSCLLYYSQLWPHQALLSASCVTFTSSKIYEMSNRSVWNRYKLRQLFLKNIKKH